LREIVIAAYSKYLGRMSRPPAPMLDDIGPHVDAGEVWVIGRPIRGLVCLSPADECLLVENVAVHPDAQGRGIGRRLLAFAEEESRRLGFDRVVLYTNEVMSENVAIYTHLGYREIDRRSEEGYRRVFMEKVLRSE
jgi:GNAT superfamily N-acetyltransferase